jgi:hypothetical protein
MTEPFWSSFTSGIAGNGPAALMSRAGATAARMVLGTALSRLRQGAGLSAGQASEVTGVPTGVITGMELGRADVRLWDVAGLYSAYGVDDVAERSTLLGLAHRANGTEWWHGFRDVIPDWFEHYLGLEQAASLIRLYSGQPVPALLQTPAYARELIRLSHVRFTDAELERRVELRLRRQHILHSDQPLRLWVVIDEAALRRLAGPPSVMRDQIRHLIRLCDLPHVTIRVLPFRLGAHPANAGGPISVLRLPDRELPDIAFVEHFGGAEYFQSRAELDYFRHVLNLLALQAAQAGPVKDFLAQVLSET